MSQSGHSRPPPSPVYTLRGAGSPVTALRFCDSMHSLLTGCQDGRVHVWDLAVRRTMESINAHNDRSVLFVESRDGGQTLLTQGRDGCFKLWKCHGASYELDSKNLTLYFIYVHFIILLGFLV
jgi:WD40 repeat protein